MTTSGSAFDPAVDRQKILDLASAHVIPGRISSFADLGISIVMGKRAGYRFWDVDGREFMDFHINGGTFNLGHRNPELIRLLRESLDDLDMGNHHFPSVARARLGEKLSRLSPGGKCKYVVYTAGAGEANDVAVKSARAATGRRKIVAPEFAYHGRTILSGALGEDSHARYFRSDYPDECVKVPFLDLDALEAALRRRDVAAVMMETIPAAYGFPSVDDGYLPAVKRLCERYGSLYICDEVQTGFGRTGRLWGIECWNVEPDIMVIGKGMSGGLYPIAAALLSESAGRWLIENGWGHVSTFGGSEIGAALASHVVDRCSDPATLSHAVAMSDYLNAGFIDIQKRHPYLLEVRRKGLVMSVKLDHPNGAAHMMKTLYDNGVWTIYSPFDAAALQWNPGLLVDAAYCDEALERFERAVRAAESVAGSREPVSFLRAS